MNLLIIRLIRPRRFSYEPFVNAADIYDIKKTVILPEMRSTKRKT